MVALSRADLDRLAEIIREETGNQISEKNLSMVESRMRSYVERLKLDKMTAYWKHFTVNEIAERGNIAGLMTTHYTFFFREFLHFEVLKDWIQGNGPRLKGRFQESQVPLKIWSAACSRGQEVYSLALFLEEELVKKWNVPYHILGTDIDKDSANYGTNGVYPLKEINSIPRQYLGTYIKKGQGAVKEFGAMDPRIKDKVSFRAANLLSIPADIADQSMDVIFCRNVFIYFSEDQVQKIALNLERRLGPGGLFVTGVTEPMRFAGWNLETVGPSSYLKPWNGPVVHKKIATVSAVKSYKVLVVDDSPTIQKLMKSVFSTDPLCQQIEYANNGREARKMLDTHSFDLITLDIHMPEVNGIEFLERLYQPKVDPPVLMISSVNRTDLDLASKSLRLGASDYVEKPSMNQIRKSTDEILMKVRRILDGPSSNPADVTDEKMNFDVQIGQKIVIPDASRCLRVINGSSLRWSQVKQVLESQKSEYRSPATMVVFSSSQEVDQALADYKSTAFRPLENLVDNRNRLLRPNHFYFISEDQLRSFELNELTSQISLQILVPFRESLLFLFKGASIQVLLDETLIETLKSLEATIRRKVSDVTPATSFSSLSAEYFANLRSVAA